MTVNRSRDAPRLLVKFIKDPKLLPKTCRFDLYRRPSSEAGTHAVLSVLDTTGRRRVKKAVVRVAELVAALITVHGLLSFLSDMYGLLDRSGRTRWLFQPDESIHRDALCR